MVGHGSSFFTWFQGSQEEFAFIFRTVYQLLGIQSVVLEVLAELFEIDLVGMEVVYDSGCAFPGIPESLIVGRLRHFRLVGRSLLGNDRFGNVLEFLKLAR